MGGGRHRKKPPTSSFSHEKNSISGSLCQLRIQLYMDTQAILLNSHMCLSTGFCVHAMSPITILCKCVQYTFHNTGPYSIRTVTTYLHHGYRRVLSVVLSAGDTVIAYPRLSSGGPINPVHHQVVWGLRPGRDTSGHPGNLCK